MEVLTKITVQLQTVSVELEYLDNETGSSRVDVNYSDAFAGVLTTDINRYADKMLQDSGYPDAAINLAYDKETDIITLTVQPPSV